MWTQGHAALTNESHELNSPLFVALSSRDACVAHTRGKSSTTEEDAVAQMIRRRRSREFKVVTATIAGLKSLGSPAGTKRASWLSLSWTVAELACAEAVTTGWTDESLHARGCRWVMWRRERINRCQVFACADKTIGL